MNKRFIRIVAMLMILCMATVFTTSCMTNYHTIGKGSQTGSVKTGRQWYALWGLIKIGDVDTRKMAGESTDYEIKTYFGGIDWLVGMFLGWLTLNTRTVKVIK